MMRSGLLQNFPVAQETLKWKFKEFKAELKAELINIELNLLENNRYDDRDYSDYVEEFVAACIPFLDSFEEAIKVFILQFKKSHFKDLSDISDEENENIKWIERKITNLLGRIRNKPALFARPTDFRSNDKVYELKKFLRTQITKKIEKVHQYQIARIKIVDDYEQEEIRRIYTQYQSEIKRYSCPFTGKIMAEPVLATDGCIYEKEAIEDAINNNKLSPSTKKKFGQTVLSFRQYVTEIRELISNYPILMRSTYLPKKWQNDLVTSIKENEFDKFINIIDKDERLLSEPLLERGEDIFHIVCEFGSSEMIEELIKRYRLKKGNDNEIIARLTTSDISSSLYPPLYLAAYHSNENKRVLLTILNNFNVKELERKICGFSNGEMSLFRQALEERKQRWAISKVQEIFNPIIRIDEILLQSIRNGRDSEALLLLKMGANPNAISKEEKELRGTALHIAIRLKYPSTVNLLLHGEERRDFYPVQLDAIDSEKNTSLHLAVTMNLVKVVDWLLMKNAPINLKDVKGRTPLHLAILNGNKNILTLLLTTNGINVNEVDEDINTALHLVPNAPHNCRLDMVAILAKHGINVRARNKEGNTILHLSAKLGMYDLFQKMFEYGVEDNIKNNAGQKAIALIENRAQVDNILEMIRRKKLDIEKNIREDMVKKIREEVVAELEAKQEERIKEIMKGFKQNESSEGPYHHSRNEERKHPERKHQERKHQERKHPFSSESTENHAIYARVSNSLSDSRTEFGSGALMESKSIWEHQEESISESFYQAVSKTSPIKIAGLKYRKIPGDGHCLYNAVALYLGEDQSFIRRMVAARMEAEPDKFAEYIDLQPGQTIMDYVQAVRNGKEWASHVEIEVLMSLLDRPIIVIDPQENIRNPEGVSRFKGEPIFVFYNDHNHYDALLLREGANGREILSKILHRREIDQKSASFTQINERSLVSHDHARAEEKKLFRAVEAWELEKALQFSLEKPPLGDGEQVKKIARSLGFELQSVLADGKRFFHAVLHQLKNSRLIDQYHQSTIKQLIVKTVRYILEHVDEFIESETNDVDDFISQLIEGKSWAEHKCILALARALNLKIIIINSDNSKPIIIEGLNPVMTIYLAYEVGLQYQSMIKASDNLNYNQSLDDYIKSFDSQPRDQLTGSPSSMTRITGSHNLFPRVAQVSSPESTMKKREDTYLSKSSPH